MIALVGSLAALIAGVALGERLGPGTALPALSAGAGAMALAVWWRGRRGALLAILACGLLGSALSQRALHGMVVSPLAAPALRSEHGLLVGRVVDDPDGPRFEVRFLVRADSWAGRDAGGRRVLVVASGDPLPRARVLEAGDRVVLEGMLGELLGYDARYRWQHAVARLRLSDVRAFAPATGVLARAANAMRGAVLRGAAGLPASERALLAGFLLGDTRAIPDPVVADFRAAGMSHLLAVSGANVAFVLVLVGPVLRRLRLGPRLVGGLTVLVVFGSMTRWEPSVLRATAMAALVMLGAFLGRPVAPGRVLTLAALLLLAVDPFLLHSIGFLLSCTACAGIVVLAAPIAARLRGPPWVRDGLGVTLAAQVGVAPVLLSVFGTVPLVAVPANLLAVPVVGPLTVWGLLAGVFGGLAGPGPARLLQLPTLVLLRWVATVARVAARAPFAVDGRAALGLGALACLVAAALVARAGAARRLRPHGRRARGEGDRPDPAGPGAQGPARPPRR